eukprot:gene5639-biopygen7440
MAVAQLFMAALRALYGLATQAELIEYSSLITKGSQGERSIQQFAQHVLIKGEAVRGMVIDLDRDMLYKFMGGLKSDVFRGYAQEEVKRQPINQPAMSVRQLGLTLAAYEKRAVQELQSEMHAASLSGCEPARWQQLLDRQRQLLGNSSSSSSDIDPATDAPSKGKYGPDVDRAVHRAAPNDAVKQEQIYEMYAQHTINPKHQKSLCSDHGLQAKRGKVHSNENCPDRQPPQQQPQLHGFAAVMQGDQSSLESKIAAAVSTALAAQMGLPKQTPKAALEHAGAGRGQRWKQQGQPSQQQQQRLTGPPCQLCGLPFGHPPEYAGGFVGNAVYPAALAAYTNSSSFCPGSSSGKSADPNTAAGGRRGSRTVPQPVSSGSSSGSGSSSSTGRSSSSLPNEPAPNILVERSVVALAAEALESLLESMKAAPPAPSPPLQCSHSAAATPKEPPGRLCSSRYSSSNSNNSNKNSIVITDFPTPELLYEIPPMDLSLNSKSSRCLHTLVPGDADQPPEKSPYACQLPDGRWIVPKKVVDDTGCTPPLWTEAACLKYGMPFTRTETPTVLKIDNTVATIIGYTSPHWVLVGGNTSRPLKKFLREGSLVLAGDAGNMFECCIGTETLKEYFPKVETLHQHFCWYPGAPIGDVSCINGVRVTIHTGMTLGDALQHGAGLIAAACQPVTTSTTQQHDVSVASAEGSFPTLLNLQEVEPVSMSATEATPAWLLADGSVQDPCLIPAAAKAAARQHQRRNWVSLSSCMQQCWVFLLLLGAALLASPVAAAPKPGQFVPAEVHELRRQISLQSLSDSSQPKPDITISCTHLLWTSSRLKGKLNSHMTHAGQWILMRHYTPEEHEVGDTKVAEMLEADIIAEVPTTNRHASAITLPMQRAPDGSWTDKRFCIDLRHVNSTTVADKYGLPLPGKLFQRMRGCKYMTKLDSMRSGFFAVALDEESKLQTTFWWRGKLYAFNRLPFGHVNATAIFQRRMELELQQAGLTHCTSVFVDDVSVFSNTMEEHIDQLDKLLTHFAKMGLRAHPSKTIVAVDCLPYLGHLVTATELKPDPAKVYDRLKAALTTPGLALKQPDPALPYRLYTDWSCTGIAALLNQVHPDGSEHLVACVSRTLNPAERNYAAWKGELLAAVYGIKAFRPYLLCQQFQLITDHHALLWLLTHKTHVGQQARWLLSLSEYQFNLVHRVGAENPADVPSREPLACMADWTGSRVDTGDETYVLPSVFLADGKLDPVVYTHDQLAVDFGLQPSSTAITATSVVCSSPALVLAQEAHHRSPSDEEATASLLFALSAITASSALSAGVVLYEPFGGLCAGLEMAAYPEQLPLHALQSAFLQFPANVKQVDEACVRSAVQQHPNQQWLVVGGWPCQDLSNAGQAQGMQGHRAQLLHDVVRIVKSLQQHCELPPAYLIENVNFQNHRKERIASDDFAVVCSLIGQPVMFDAAQCGSLAHRVRNYWTNLCCDKRVAAAFEHVQRPPGRTVALALQPGRCAQPVVSRERAPYFPCNQPGEPRAAWPTLMSRPQSYAFRAGQPGSIWDCSNPAAAFWDEPNAHERGVSLGYEPGSTAADGVSEQQRRSALGQCMDANALQVLMAISQAWWFDDGSFALPAGVSNGSIAASAVVGSDEVVGEGSGVYYTSLHVGSIAAAAQEALAAGSGNGEIWADHPVLTALQQGTHPPDANPAVRKRVQRRLELYAWDQQHQQLNRIMPDGTYKIVPKPADRLALVQQQHEQCGHFGVKRTAALLLGKYWCAQIKYLVAVPLPDKKPETVALAFLRHVLSRFAAPGQVVSDNGAEFTQGAFKQLLMDCLIDHCLTSVCHPRANGQAEKAVHIVKRALSTMSVQKHAADGWDRDVAFLGYNCSTHSSTGYSPYQLMHVRQPIAPPAIRSSMAQPIDYEDESAAAEDLHQRQLWVQQHMPEALENLKIAQHRDQKRYAVVRSAAYQPRVYRFQPGDYVYVQQLQRHNTLQPHAKPVILRVVQVESTGVLRLEGKCGRMASVRQEHCAPCHLPNIDGTLDPVLVNDWDRLVCEVCDKAAPESKLLLCDMCNSGYHMQCLQSPVTAVPTGVWLCHDCVADGLTAADVAERQAQRDLVQEQRQQPNMFPDAAMSRRDKAAAVLHGRLVIKVWNDSVTGQPRPYWGRVHFRGAEYRSNYFVVVYEDGDYHAATVTAVKKLLQPEFVSVPKWVATLSYLGSAPQQLQLQMQQLGVRLHSAQMTSAAAAVMVSAQPASVMATIIAAEQFSLRMALDLVSAIILLVEVLLQLTQTRRNLVMQLHSAGERRITFATFCRRWLDALPVRAFCALYSMFPRMAFFLPHTQWHRDMTLVSERQLMEAIHVVLGQAHALYQGTVPAFLSVLCDVLEQHQLDAFLNHVRLRRFTCGERATMGMYLHLVPFGLALHMAWAAIIWLGSEARIADLPDDVNGFHQQVIMYWGQLIADHLLCDGSVCIGSARMGPEPDSLEARHQAAIGALRSSHEQEMQELRQQLQARTHRMQEEMTQLVECIEQLQVQHPSSS